MKPTKTEKDVARSGLRNDLRRTRTAWRVTRAPGVGFAQHENGHGGRSVEDYIQRLKLMVPNIGTDEKLNEFEILQRVIEYIQLLEDALGINVATPSVSSLKFAHE